MLVDRKCRHITFALMERNYLVAEVSDKRTEKLFYGLPDIIYAQDPNWIPHIRQDIEKLFDPRKNKLLKDGVAKRWILTDTNGKVIGRIAAFVNKKLAYDFDQPTGGTGFFECIDDQEAADMLFDLSKEWLIKQGMEAMDGPINFGDKNQFWGLLVQNFNDPNSYGLNYNPSYYRDLFESYGFKTYYEQYVYSRPTRQQVEEVFVRKANLVLANYDVQVRDCQGMSIQQIADDFRTVYNGAWGGHDNFKKMSESGAMKVAKSLKPIMDPEIIIFAYSQGEPIGFYVNIPELNEIFRHVNGNLNWIGKLKFLYYKAVQKPKRMVGIVFGVVRKWHGKGIEGAIIMWFSQHKVPVLTYDDTILTWIGDFNPKMIKVATNLGSDLYRTYITYRYLFDRTAPFERCKIIQ